MEGSIINLSTNEVRVFRYQFFSSSNAAKRLYNSLLVLTTSMPLSISLQQQFKRTSKVLSLSAGLVSPRKVKLGFLIPLSSHLPRMPLQIIHLYQRFLYEHPQKTARTHPLLLSFWCVYACTFALLLLRHTQTTARRPQDPSSEADRGFAHGHQTIEDRLYNVLIRGIFGGQLAVQYYDSECIKRPLEQKC